MFEIDHDLLLRQSSMTAYDWLLQARANLEKIGIRATPENVFRSAELAAYDYRTMVIAHDMKGKQHGINRSEEANVL